MCFISKFLGVLRTFANNQINFNFFWKKYFQDTSKIPPRYFQDTFRMHYEYTLSLCTTQQQPSSNLQARKQSQSIHNESVYFCFQFIKYLIV